MRLSNKEVQSITSNIQLIDPKAQIFLFGSRAIDSLRGGDIDLLVISEKISFSDKITILGQIKQEIGEQKIDLIVSSFEKSKNDAFIQSVLKNAVDLTQ